MKLVLGDKLQLAVQDVSSSREEKRSQTFFRSLRKIRSEISLIFHNVTHCVAGLLASGHVFLLQQPHDPNCPLTLIPVCTANTYITCVYCSRNNQVVPVPRIKVSKKKKKTKMTILLSFLLFFFSFPSLIGSARAGSGTDFGTQRRQRLPRKSGGTYNRRQDDPKLEELWPTRRRQKWKSQHGWW